MDRGLVGSFEGCRSFLISLRCHTRPRSASGVWKKHLAVETQSWHFASKCSVLYLKRGQRGGEDMKLSCHLEGLGIRSVSGFQGLS